ncbi:phosphate/phosphite/phosphonate ABC transporter substrate-binding protein [Thermostichus vulcanus]|uniref:Phosphate/phosphite/phosphonate ABC transporter substrate-binding protein n=1 Tax=Thermostichus vulcanus str. 'Rupite' TaxID=2813851 RepID=A0ABT0CC32_THEVL|nr:phosphate/phosphite/phosphonate ABC transporter substrate-binding protein [Thermostichus vulcanus]MCJ2543351.1 phosphate/phosphite/phosphonate ABC transporter substrate-binding protein [Thermostichus vulcanus str. 'Rupite']
MMKTFLASRRSVLVGLAATVAGASLALTGLVHAQAQDCPRSPQMDERFCDRDGDLVADAPEDPSEWIDPDTLIFAYTPVEDPSVYENVWAEFLEHLAEVTGKNVEYFGVQSNAAQLEAMRAGRLHVTGFNTGSVPLAVNAVGFRPFAMMASLDGSFGYEMEIIVRADSDIQTLEDVRGRQMAFTSPTSNSGFKAPSALLQAEFDMIEGRDFEAVFSGSHENSILGVVNGDYDVASIANSVLTRMDARGAVNKNDLRSIYVSQTFPTTGYGYVYNLKPELAEKVKEAFFTFEWEGTKLAEEFGKSGEEQFIPITYKEYWEVIRQIDEIQGVEYRL